MLHSIRRRGYGAVFFFLVTTACALVRPAVAFAQMPAPPPSAVVPAKSAPGDSLAIGPGLFTFGQIAALLSTPEMPIACDPALNDRAAYVYLQARPRAQAQEILSAGLQVEFVLDEKTKSVTMVRQPSIVAREAQWLKRLARIVQTEWQAEVQKTTALSDRPFPDTDKRYALLEKIETLQKAVGQPPFSASPATEAITAQRAELTEALASLETEYRLPAPQQRMLAVWAQNSRPDFVALLQGKVPDSLYTQTVPPQWMGNGWVQQALLAQLITPTGIHLAALPAGFGPENYVWLTGYRFDAGNAAIELSAIGRLAHKENETSKAAMASVDKRAKANNEALTEEAKSAETQSTALYYLNMGFTAGLGIRLPKNGTLPPRIPAPLFLLGPDAVDWWTSEQADTDCCLITLPSDLPAPAASAPLPLAKTPREMVMELLPRPELRQAADSSSNAVPPFASWVHPPQKTDQWSVREKNNVLLITNRLAFMERPQKTPLGEWLRFSGALRQWRENNALGEVGREKSGGADRAFIDRYYPCEILENYVREVMARRDGRTWQALGSQNAAYNYHGTSLSALDTAVPAVFLWDKLTEKDRSWLLSRLQAPSPDADARFTRADFRMARFSGATLTTLAQLLRERGMPEADPKSPEFMSYLRSGVFYVTLSGEPDVTLPGYYTAEARIVFDRTRPQPDLHVDAHFLVAVPSSAKSALPTPETP